MNIGKPYWEQYKCWQPRELRHSPSFDVFSGQVCLSTALQDLRRYDPQSLEAEQSPMQRMASESGAVALGPYQEGFDFRWARL